MNLLYILYTVQYRVFCSDVARMRRLELTANSHFSGIPVNTSRSSVHVPTNVFDGEPKVINAIDWSKKLDDTFRVSP